MSGVNLASTQARLKTYLLDAANDPTAVLPLLEGGFGLAREARLDIYHSAYRARLRDALGAVFERTWTYVGDEEFERETRRYIEQTPSHSPNLRDYGGSFPEFLAASLPSDPEVAELAHMDWRLHEAFDAPDRHRLQPDALMRLSDADWESAAFVFSPGVALAVFAWNTIDVWHALDQGLTPPPARALPLPVACLFWRNDKQSSFRSLHTVEHRMLERLLAGEGFAEVCATIAGDDPDAAELFGPCLQRWLSEGLISRISTAGGTDGKPQCEGNVPT
ncbi:putative DNA-binding domain-containing protein [Azoarcus sp. L1K30]|uniref:HvfC/BufC N-terminal domain-containing protein n=1 Tax=Azoarcus sp. L1K30 TaxID=2820277 RepID=UPI001B81375C|nr:DNA-binding domain-containing protein [Azoarcus sp. L1K30]MBR0565058.1 putative DNA-binding domain-containing protein [Azoarcus sp. L1K30]